MRKRKAREHPPSRSSIVFSSFATDLSANSARVSACEVNQDALRTESQDMSKHRLIHRLL